MEKHKCCKYCIFYIPNGFQDMHATSDVCMLRGYHKEHKALDSLLTIDAVDTPCKYFTNAKEVIKNVLGSDFKEE